MKSFIMLVLVLFITGCSLVQWMPSSDCENVKYERAGNIVHIEADCEV